MFTKHFYFFKMLTIWLKKANILIYYLNVFYIHQSQGKTFRLSLFLNLGCCIYIHSPKGLLGTPY